MRQALRDIIENNTSAVIMNVKEDVVLDIVDFIKSYDYSYQIVSSESDHATVRLGFINGLNEYTGSESFIKNRIFQELSAINMLFDVNLDNYYLEYIVEWIHWLHTMSTPLNYLDNDGLLFDYLIEFFENKYYEDEAVEDQVAIKFIRIIEEMLETKKDLPVLWIRDQLFKKPSILIVCEANPSKEAYVERLIKQYYDEYVEIDGEDNPLMFIKLQN
ncbi:MAG: hypothetical protein GX074_04340 [Erysipelothrix sp.]|nr:hypothetical protein [Erysipelothrix sp.]